MFDYGTTGDLAKALALQFVAVNQSGHGGQHHILVAGAGVVGVVAGKRDAVVSHYCHFFRGLIYGHDCKIMVTKGETDIESSGSRKKNQVQN